MSFAARARRAIVVLGCSPSAGSIPGRSLELRLERARSLAEKDPAALLLVTGTKEEAAAMCCWLRKHGISPSRVVVDASANKTVDNATNTATLAKRLGIERLTLVTEAFHMLRAVTLFKSAFNYEGGRVVVDTAPAVDGQQGEQLAQRMKHEPKALARDVAIIGRRYRAGALSK